MTHQYYVSNMSCEKCKSHVEKALGKVDGVENVTVDLDRSTALVTTHDAQAVALELLQDALDSTDYEIINVLDRPETI